MENLISNLKKHVPLSAEEEVIIEQVVHFRKYGKNEFLLQAGDVCRHLNYVQAGVFRIYSIDENGFEHVNFFAVEDWWAIDLKSFVAQTPARFFIDTLEDAELLQINKHDFDRLLERIPSLEKWFRILLQNALIATEDRVTQKSSLKAEERYQQFVLKYPDLESRISQRHIAAYLGITPEFLSMLHARRKKKQNP